MFKYDSLPGLVEDLRHALMTFRRSATLEDLDAVKGAPAALAAMAHRQIETDKDAMDHDRRELELADSLVYQFEEAVVILASMIPD